MYLPAKSKLFLLDKSDGGKKVLWGRYYHELENKVFVCLFVVVGLGGGEGSQAVKNSDKNYNVTLVG